MEIMDLVDKVDVSYLTKSNSSVAIPRLSDVLLLVVRHSELAGKWRRAFSFFLILLGLLLQDALSTLV